MHQQGVTSLFDDAAIGDRNGKSHHHRTKSWQQENAHGGARKHVEEDTMRRY
jgi:hypothetical protein